MKDNAELVEEGGRVTIATVEYFEDLRVLKDRTKVRGEITIGKDVEDESVAVELAMAQEKVARYTEAGKVVKVIFRPGKILNFIVK